MAGVLSSSTFMGVHDLFAGSDWFSWKGPKYDSLLILSFVTYVVFCYAHVLISG